MVRPAVPGPSEAERQRYLEIVDLARQRGSLDDTEWTRRRKRVASASTRAELDGVVADLPAAVRRPRPPASARAWAATLAVAVVVGLMGAGVVAGLQEEEPSTTAVAADAPDTDQAAAGQDVAGGEAVSAGLLAPGMLEALLDELAARNVETYKRITIWPDRAVFEVPVAPGARQFDMIEFRDGTFGEREPRGQLDSDDEPGKEYFDAAEIAPGVLAAATARAADIAGYEGRSVDVVHIGRHSGYGGTVTISVHLEGDDYGTAPVVEWDGTGEHLLRDGA